MPVSNLQISDIETGGGSSYSHFVDEIVPLLVTAEHPPNSHSPCLVIIGDGHVDEGFDKSMQTALKSDLFKSCTRLVVEVGRDFNSSGLRDFVSASDNFFSVMDISSMPLFYLRLAARINSQPTSSRSRRILDE
jgi:hypothetical protein